MDILERTSGKPVRILQPGEVLVAQGAAGGDLFILEHGRLLVERDHVTLTTISIPGALIGEMSVLLLRPASATVRAEIETRVRTIPDARNVLKADPELTFHVACLVANRLDNTSAVLVDLNREHRGETRLLSRLLAAIHRQPDGDAVH
jgi:CRP-like cAMP-binding protein